MRVVELDRPAGPAALYGRAVLGALPGSGAGRARDAAPDTELVLRGVAVDRKHLAAYDRVCGFRLADTLPATYPHVLAFPLAIALMSARDFPFSLLGIVHVANRITMSRPIDAGERLDLAVHATDLRPHERGRQIDLVATATVAGEQVWRGVSTYLHKERDRERNRQGRGEGDRPAPPAPTAVWRVRPRVGTDYAGVSGDHNPIHTSRLGARLFGFPRPIAHGMWSKARCLAALEGRLPDAYTVDVAFKLPVLLPATVGFAASPPPRGWRFSLHDARSGRPHLTGTIT
ncbi:MAG TPA: MaoC/PaaZ C-terminal domain-containing protein [Pilimelia sp.]|nr:MaoC/PaaZ C-terminal domain-containing protein [Pilimelia sp.]